MTTEDALHCALRCIDAATPPVATAALDSDDGYKQSLENSIQALDHQLKPDAETLKKRDDDHSAATELAAACRATCSRLLVLANARAPKRINTSPGTWKSAPSHPSLSRQGLESKRLRERLDELRSSLVVEIGKSLRYASLLLQPILLQ